MNRFANKAIVITGGSSGIGLATAKRISAEGGAVLVTGTDKIKLAAVRETNKNIHVMENDAAEPSAAAALAEVVTQLFGKIDGVFLNAGAAAGGPLESLTPDSFHHMINLNVAGPLFGAQALVPLMRPHGSILMTASTAGKKGYAGATLYCAAKGAVIAMARSLASELSSRPIRVNTISPGGTKTDFFARLGLPPAQTSAIEEQVRTTNPLRRLASADEIAAVAAFLLSDEASFVTGADYACDGGEVSI